MIASADGPHSTTRSDTEAPVCGPVVNVHRQWDATIPAHCFPALAEVAIIASEPVMCEVSRVMHTSAGAVMTKAATYRIRPTATPAGANARTIPARCRCRDVSGKVTGFPSAATLRAGVNLPAPTGGATGSTKRGRLREARVGAMQASLWSRSGVLITLGVCAVLTACASPPDRPVPTPEPSPFVALPDRTGGSPSRPVLPEVSSTPPQTWLEVDGSWRGWVILPDAGTSACSHQQVSAQRWFEATTSNFAEFDAGGADPGREFTLAATVDLEPRPSPGTDPQARHAVIGTFVDSSGAHVQFHSTDDLDLEVRDEGRQVVFALSATGSGVDIDPAPLTVRGAITCAAVTKS